MTLTDLLSTSSDHVVLGATQPRLWTPPLRELTPATSYGYDVIDFARDVIGKPLDPWQEWLVIHGGELLPDDRPRFRTVLALVARQGGKTYLVKVLTLFWLFVEFQPMVLGTSTSRDYAKAAWRAVVDMAQESELLGPEVENVRLAIGEETLTTRSVVEETPFGTKTRTCEYKFAATNRRAGRSLTINRLVLDELREHRNWDTWNASTNAMNAVPSAQAWAITNQGDDQSVVLDALRTPAVGFIETGHGDPRLGLFEWSAPAGCDPDDVHALAAANPNLGRRNDLDSLIGAARRAKAAGGEELASFRTEVLCQRVHLLDPAIDPDSWTRAGTEQPIDLAEHRGRVALCVDVSLDGSHASLVAAAVLDGIVHVEVITAWQGFGCTKMLRADLPTVVEKVRPRALGWFPSGPAASVAAHLQETRGWPPRGCELSEIRGDATAVCMGLAEQVRTQGVRHPNDPMLTAHVSAAQRLMRGDAWVFMRKNTGPIDGTYALAGAVHLARTLPPPLPPLVAL